MGGRMTNKAISKRGAIGQQIFDRVEQLTANGAMKRLAAFKQIAESSGRSTGTVAANYYRIARLKGAPLRSRRPRMAAGARGKTSSRVAAALNVIAAALRSQEQELAQLRSQSAAFAKLRQLLER